MSDLRNMIEAFCSRYGVDAQRYLHPEIGYRSGHLHVFEIVCYDKFGRLQYNDVGFNLVVNVGLDDILKVYYSKETTPATNQYTGLTDANPTVAATDTMASHPGWDELTPYSETNRPTVVWGSVSGQTTSNSASKAVFSINAGPQDIGGGFLTDNNSKGGSAGLLVGAAAYTGGNKSTNNGDTLNQTVTASNSSS